jgi:hypothetical protein
MISHFSLLLMIPRDISDSLAIIVRLGKMGIKGGSGWTIPVTTLLS